MSLNEVKKSKGRPSKRPLESELAFLYSGMTVRQLAEHYKVSTNTVKSWIAYYRKGGVSNDAK